MCENNFAESSSVGFAHLSHGLSERVLDFENLEMSGIVLNYIVPAVGDVLSTLLYLSPLYKGYKIHKAGHIGEFDLIPYAMMLFNNLVWSIYALGLDTPSQFFVITPNFVGLVSTVMVFTWTMHMTSEALRKKLQLIFLFITALYIPAVYIVLVTCDHDTRQSIFSIFTLIVQFCFLSSPLRNTLEIIKQRDASSIYLPLSVTVLISCLFWAVYGFVLMDKTIYIPNCISSVLGVLQLLLKIIFPSRNVAIQKVDDSEEESHQSAKQVQEEHDLEIAS
jgi:solute carrier family 50 protein (sugar transporter)